MPHLMSPVPKFHIEDDVKLNTCATWQLNLNVKCHSISRATLHIVCRTLFHTWISYGKAWIFSLMTTQAYHTRRELG